MTLRGGFHSTVPVISRGVALARRVLLASSKGGLPMRHVISACALTTVLGVAGPTVAPARAATNVCRTTSKLAISACQGQAQVNKLIARGKCDNLTDVAAKKACQDQAVADAKDAFQTCMDERGVRQTSCER